MIKFFTDFEQATKNDKKDYNTEVEKFFNKNLIKNFKEVAYQGTYQDYFVKNFKTN